MTDKVNAGRWRPIDGWPTAILFHAPPGEASHFHGFNLFLLTTTGAKSGQPQLALAAYVIIDDQLIVAGSGQGAPNDADWVYNLRITPRAEVDIQGVKYQVIAHELPPAECAGTAAKIIAVWPRFHEYQSMVGRQMPLFELHPIQRSE